MAERSSAPDSSSGVSDQQSVGSSPGLDTCVLEQDTQQSLFHPLDGTSSHRSRSLGNARKELGGTYCYWEGFQEQKCSPNGNISQDNWCAIKVNGVRSGPKNMLIPCFFQTLHGKTRVKSFKNGVLPK